TLGLRLSLPAIWWLAGWLRRYYSFAEMRTKRVVLAILGTLLGLLCLVVVVDFLYIKLAGSPVPVPNIDRTPRQFGTTGAPLKLAILGDSRTVSQGGDYEKGIAVGAAQYLAKSHQVTLYNYGVAGARARDVIDKQVPEAVKDK